MEKHSKHLENLRVERDSLQTNLKETNANYWNFEGRKGYSKCRTQQTSERLQEHGTNSLQAIGVGGT
jgi:hypothetical protein